MPLGAWSVTARSATLQQMLTRSAVAKRLMCSLATVRRLEGHELFPQRDAHGVHRFDEAQVDRVLRTLPPGRRSVAHGRWLASGRRDALPSRAGKAAARAEPPSAQTDLQRLRRENRRLSHELNELKQLLSQFLVHLDVTT